MSARAISEPAGLVENAPLDRLTTIKVGGTADRLCRVESFSQAVAALAWAESRDLVVAIVGKGSNLIVADDGFRGLAVQLTGRLSSISVRGGGLWCGGGASLPRAVQRAAAAGLTGLEFGASIPGTVGGAVAMNAGAYSAELKDVIDWAVICTADGRERVRADELAMGYRSSSVGAQQIVAAVGFDLAPGDPDQIAGRLAELRGHRRATQPQGVRTFGSVFTNPPGDSAGRLLEQAGCKELRVGDARFSPVHANFIEAGSEATAADVLALMREGRRRVREAGGPTLRAEVRYLHPTEGIRAAISREGEGE
ncbi:MAG: UDP-N-acetylmuramate dehydrogenase [Thermoleophilia bacterium]|nr:UDP-N-acetylmuramate dehydrogenase [Thermoleophilia bacterium]MDH3725484.1 UDP-N-acetylmuramate dehydrogenase [Thermoleophilia bacterium]